MSLPPQEIPPIPEETRRVAQAAFPRGHAYRRLRDALGTIYEEHLFAALFPARGQPAESPWRLALTTVMQFAGGVSDRQAADVVRSRIDWKYALSLELTDAGSDHTVLLWLSGDQLRAVFDNVVVAEYHCQYDWRRPRVINIQDGVFYRTRYAHRKAR